VSEREETSRADQLDEIDVEIVSLLAQDARISARGIAREVGMSPGAISERISRLEQRNVITGYRVLVNPEALGYAVHALVGVETEQGPVLNEVIEQLMAIPEVATVQIVTGQWDLMVELRVRDHPHLLHVVTSEIYGIRGFRHCETMISLTLRTPEGGWLPPELRKMQWPLEHELQAAQPDGDVRRPPRGAMGPRGRNGSEDGGVSE